MGFEITDKLNGSLSLITKGVIVFFIVIALFALFILATIVYKKKLNRYSMEV